jgi:hypothetical protein
MLTDCNDAHAQSASPAHDLTSDAAKPHEPESGARDFSRPGALVPHQFLCPDMLSLKVRSSVQILCQSENHGDHKFGHNGTMYVARIRENNIALDQLGIHQLIYSSRGGVNPAKATSNVELLRAQRPRHQSFSVLKMSFQPCVVFEVYNIDLRKLAP